MEVVGIRPQEKAAEKCYFTAIRTWTDHHSRSMNTPRGSSPTLARMTDNRKRERRPPTSGCGRSATGRRRRPACQTRSRLHLRLFCHFERVIYFDAQVPHRAFQLAVAEQELDGPKILCSSVDKGGLGARQRVRSVSRRIQTNLTHPVTDD